MRTEIRIAVASGRKRGKTGKGHKGPFSGDGSALYFD